MPSNYGGFRDRVQKLEVRKTIKALDQLKGLPSSGDVQIDDIPTLMDLGLNPSATMSQDGKAGANTYMAGGEGRGKYLYFLFQKYWVDGLTMYLSLITKFLGDMEALLQEGTPGTMSQFHRLLALLSCFSTILQLTTSGLLEMNMLE